MVSCSHCLLSEAEAWPPCLRKRKHSESGGGWAESSRRWYQACVSLRVPPSEDAGQSPFWTLAHWIIMTLLSVYLGVGWGSREGGGVHALQPNSSMGMGQQLWRHPQGQREKSYCYSPCSQSSALVTSFWMNALGSLITLLFVVGMIFLKLGSYPVT